MNQDEIENFVDNKARLRIIKSVFHSLGPEDNFRLMKSQRMAATVPACHECSLGPLQQIIGQK